MERWWVSSPGQLAWSSERQLARWVGSLVDVAEGDSSEDVVRWLGRAVPPGHTAAIGLVVEATPAVVDALAWDLGVAVLRRSRDQIEQEIAAAEIEARGEEATDAPGRTGERLT